MTAGAYFFCVKTCENRKSQQRVGFCIADFYKQNVYFCPNMDVYAYIVEWNLADCPRFGLCHRLLGFQEPEERRPDHVRDIHARKMFVLMLQ